MFRWLVLVVAVAGAWARAETPLSEEPKPEAQASTSAGPGLRSGAALQQTPDLEAAPEDLSLGWTLVRTALMLGAVLALVYLTLNVGLRRLLGIRAQPLGKQVVKVLERVPLDPKRSLFVVRAANEVLLIGGSENSLELITRLDASEVERLRSESSLPAALQLSPLLQRLLGRKDAPPPPASS